MISIDGKKRIVDVLVSFVFLVLFSPVLILTALVVLIFLGRPVIFSQARPGKDGELFNLYKFRSMMNSVNSDGELLSDEQRVSSFGLLLRRSSLDELPALFNVLKGDMSLVGPRPLLVEYLPLYSDEQRRRHEVRPGITGLAQVNGRNALSWQEKFDYDVQYVKTRSLWLDATILIKTFWTVLCRKGISSGMAVGMEKFSGNHVKE